MDITHKSAICWNFPNFNSIKQLTVVITHFGNNFQKRLQQNFPVNNACYTTTTTTTIALRLFWILSGTTQVSQYQQGKTKNQSAFTGARDNEWQLHQLGHM